jgi:hypothetical protein
MARLDGQETARLGVSPRTIRPDQKSTVTVTALLPSGKFPVRSVTLFRVSGGKGVELAQMRDDGANGDAKRSDRIYTAVVSFQEKQGVVVVLQAEINFVAGIAAIRPQLSEMTKLVVQGVVPASIEIVSLNPATVQAGARAQVRVTARLVLGGFQTQKVDLYRDKTPLGQMKMTSGDRKTAEIYESVILFGEKTAGRIDLAASAMVVPFASEFATPTEVRSRVATLIVEPAAAPPSPPSVEITRVDPASVLAGAPAQITVTARVSKRQGRVTALELFEQNGTARLALFKDSGSGDGFYVAQTAIARAAPGPMPLVAKLSFELPTAVGRVVQIMSQPFALQVLPAPATNVIRDKGISLVLPPGFTRLDTKGGPISLDNFGHKYLKGGIPPGGGCVIEATQTTVPPRGAGALIAEETEAPAAQVRQRRIAGLDAFQARYPVETAGGRDLLYVAVYVNGRNALYKFFASHGAGDAGAAKCVQSFEAVLGSARFAE